MTSKREALLDTSRLAKFLLLLRSDKPGEVVATANALCRTLKSDGHDRQANRTKKVIQSFAPSAKARMPQHPNLMRQVP